MKRSKKMLAAVAALGAGLLPALAVQARERTVFVPSGSMEPTLKVGSRIWVQPRPYASAAQVRRGDIVVHEVAERGRSERRIKRVVGLPGDFIVLSGESVWINGKLLPHATTWRQGALKTVRETNGGASYVVKYGRPSQAGSAQLLGRLSRTLAPGEFYLLGDNRDNSLDSRFLGPVSFASIVARYNG